MKYRRKPLVVEAFQATAECMMNGPFPAWFTEAISIDQTDPGSITCEVDGDTVFLAINTHGKPDEIEPDDWVVRGPTGWPFTMKPEAFEMAYALDVMEAEEKPDPVRAAAPAMLEALEADAEWVKHEDAEPDCNTEALELLWQTHRAEGARLCARAERLKVSAIAQARGSA